MNRYIKFGLPVAAILGTLAWLNLRSPEVSYFKTIPEVKQMGDQAHGKRLRVNGWVKEGSIKREGSNSVFLLVENRRDRDPGDYLGDSMTVVYNGNDPLPHLFKDRVQAMADGELGTDGAFNASGVAAGFPPIPDEFDLNKKVIFHGKGTQFEWSIPRVRLHVDVIGQDGAVMNWIVEGGPANALLRDGWTPRSPWEGMEVAVDGYPAKDGTMRAIGRAITFADGKKLSTGSCCRDFPHGESSD